MSSRTDSTCSIWNCSIFTLEDPGRVVGIGVDPAETRPRESLLVHDDHAVEPARASRETLAPTARGIEATAGLTLLAPVT